MKPPNLYGREGKDGSHFTDGEWRDQEIDGLVFKSPKYLQLPSTTVGAGAARYLWKYQALGNLGKNTQESYGRARKKNLDTS